MVNLLFFSFIYSAFVFKNPSWNKRSPMFSTMLSSKRFIVLYFTFRSVILIQFLWMLKVSVQINISSCGFLIIPEQRVEKTILCPFKCHTESYLYTGGCASGLSTRFHWHACLCSASTTLSRLLQLRRMFWSQVMLVLHLCCSPVIRGG